MGVGECMCVCVRTKAAGPATTGLPGPGVVVGRAFGLTGNILKRPFTAGVQIVAQK